MSHTEMEEQVALLAGGELERPEACEVERHLAGCSECRELARELSETREWLGELASEEPDRAALASVRESVLAATSPRRWPWMVAAAAALTMALAIGELQQFRKPIPQPMAVVYSPEAPEVRRTPKPEPVLVAAVEPEREIAVEPMVIKILTDDPDVVIYWLVEGSDD